MCDKVPDDYLHVLKFVPNCYVTQTMCDKSVNTHPSATKFVPDCYKSQEMYDRVVYEDAFFDTILPW